ncbi:MAG TPA: RNA 2',3'-cyclic phosphodiesterase [Candidatus Acidoferrales bacterium]|nr:RNA 2',3'-cyclic phosphodiesterase [Candidatus Acidoferrales bacterium]
MRLFVALDLPEAAHHKLRDLIAELRNECPDIRWVRPEGIHVTLKFIGHVDEAKAHEIQEALGKIHSDRPVIMELHGIGFFPNERRPRVVWCGVHGSDNLAKLAGDMEALLEPLGIEREARPYTPHLTLARIDPEKVRRAQVEKVVATAKKFEVTSFGSARETQFHLYESVTKPSGAEYKILQSFSFVKGSA